MISVWVAMRSTCCVSGLRGGGRCRGHPSLQTGSAEGGATGWDDEPRLAAPLRVGAAGRWRVGGLLWRSAWGHENATLVLTTYGHLLPDSEDRTRRAVDDAWISDGPGTDGGDHPQTSFLVSN
jgi:hypothetical protein